MYKAGKPGLDWEEFENEVKSLRRVLSDCIRRFALEKQTGKSSEQLSMLLPEMPYIVISCLSDLQAISIGAMQGAFEGAIEGAIERKAAACYATKRMNALLERFENEDQL